MTMTETERDSLAAFIVSSWPTRGLNADTWADELATLTADRQSVEMAVRRLRARTNTPPAISDLRAELSRSSSTPPPPRRAANEEPAISLSEYLKRVAERESKAKADELELKMRRFSRRGTIDADGR